MQIITNKAQKELKSHGDYQLPLLVSHECLSRYETGSFLWHWHPEIELTLIQEGEIHYRVNHQSFHLKEGQALFCGAGALHTGSRIANHDCRYISVTFDPRLIYGYENSLIQEHCVLPLLQAPELSALALDGSEAWHQEGRNCILRLISLYEGRPAAWELDILLSLLSFWKLLFLHMRPTACLSVNDAQNYSRIRSILAYIGVHYSERITLEDIGRELHLCPGECSRLFSRYMNQPLFEFILEYRIEKSLPLLADSSITITQAAAGAGFNDPNYFSKTFARFKGCSPSVYRKRAALGGKIKAI